jgi:predicted dehydrogenase
LLWTHSAHLFDSVRHLLGDVESVTGTRSNVGADYAWQGVMSLAAGGVGTYELTVNTHGEWSEGFQINGEHGSMTIDTYFPFFRRASRTRVYADATQSWTEAVFDDTNAYERQLESFARAILDSGVVSPDARDGLAVVRLITAVAESIDSGGLSRVLV